MAHTVDLLYSDTERTLAAALADLLSSRAQASDVVARTEKPDTYDLDLWHTVAAEIGLAGLLIPEPLGGAGASYRELATAAEQFGAAVAPIPYLGSAAVATAVLLSAAKSSAQRTEPAPVSPAAGLLRRMADGEVTAALAVPAATLPGAAFPSAVRVAGSAGGGMTKLSGSIPAVATFQHRLGLPAVMIGVGLPDDQIHAPNERFNLNQYFRGVRTIARLWEEMAAALG